MTTYIHQTDGRLRIRSEFILEHPADVEKLIEKMSGIPAIREVRHRRFAGSVTIRYDHHELDGESVMDMVESHGWLRSQQRSAFVENAVRSGSKTLLKGVTVMALKQMVNPSLLRAFSIS
ncbi:HMA2 domain-containing protein [Sansalvadorimonas verongulae]|uniref:HMA2 domain-containing protein n=1 Tax=Sansalvadorimonas verongulae TaxID=2172824 RepID=UPI0012BB56F9|nr:hypothetical protein [Sansalvadorimonas verongulae]MTI13708.1 hypothetical protein [Sansalvadorimonas verongulae]